MKDYTRSLEVLLRKFPNKTGSEIMTIYNQDKLEYSEYCQKQNEQIIKRTEWLKNNKYFKIIYAGGGKNINYIEVIDCVQIGTNDNIDFHIHHHSTYLSDFMNLKVDKREEKTTVLENLYSPSCDEIIVLSKEEYFNFQNKLESLFL